MPSKLEVIGHDGATFDWLNPQDGFELRRAVELLALAMRDRYIVNASPPDDFYSHIQSVYEMIWQFRENTRFAFNWYIRKDLAVGDDYVQFADGYYDWDSLGTAIGEDLTIFKNMVGDDITYIQAGTTFDKSLLTTMYKILQEMTRYRAFIGQGNMDSYGDGWVGYQDDDDDWTHFFKSNLDDDTGNDTQLGAYNSILSYINDNANYGDRNSEGSTTLLPSRVGGFFDSYTSLNDTVYNFRLRGEGGGPTLAKSFHFAYYETRSDGFQDVYSAGDFNNTFPDATTEYYQYIYATKNGTGFVANDFHAFGGGFLEDKISHIQQAYSADGYILRTAPLTMDFSTIPNELPASYGCQIRVIRAFDINEARFTDYYTV